MYYSPHIHHRRSIRLRGYDYTQPGAYFITICTADRTEIFGRVVDGNMESNETGQIILRLWGDLPAQRPNVQLGEFVVMPNHIHGILVLTDLTPVVPPAPVGAQFIAPAFPVTIRTGDEGAMNRAPTVGDIVREFKARCTYAINSVLQSRGKPIWQRNYYERIIRSDEEYARIAEYIAYNPARWSEDSLNPNAARNASLEPSENAP